MLSVNTVEVKGLKKDFFLTKTQDGVLGSIKGLFTRAKIHVEAVKGIDFSVPKGQIVGFLGPNGAGKTTTLKMLTGIIAPTDGTMEVLGHNPQKREPELLRRIALVMGNKQQLWWDLPASESFRVLRDVYDVPEDKYRERLDYLVERMNLGDKLSQQVRKMSLGERMKCELVAAFLHGPEVVFLDEPTIGLDVVSQKRIRAFLKDINNDFGTTIMLTSHYMQDVQELSDRVIVIDKGTIVFDDNLKVLQSEYSGAKTLRLTFEPDETPDDLTNYGSVISAEGEAVTLRVPTDEVMAVTSTILRRYKVTDISIEETPIDEVIHNLFEGVDPPKNVSRETQADPA